MSASVDQMLRQAKSHAKAGNRAEAERLFRAVLDRFPGNKRASEGLAALSASASAALSRRDVELALSHFRQGNLRAALAETERLAVSHPSVAFLHNLLGAIRNGLGDTETAVEHYRTAISLDPRDADALSNLGDALNTLGRHDEALAVLDRALALRPDHPAALNNLGLAHHYLGDQAKAVAAFEAALAARPGYAECWRNLSIAAEFVPGDRRIERMTAALGGATSDSDRTQLRFALGKVLDDIGETKEAFDHFVAGNRLRKAGLGYRFEEDRRLFDGIKAAFADTLIAALPTDLPVQGPRPVFVLGMPRSGTTLVEQILAGHHTVHGAGELDFLRRAVLPAAQRIRAGDASVTSGDFVHVAEAYSRALAGLDTARPVIVDKMPGNFRWIGFILAAIPGARIVHLSRDPMAVRWSIFRTFFPARGLGFAWDLGDIAAYQRLHDDLMAFWDERFPGRVYRQSYEALTENPDAEARRLLAACGLEFEAACLDFHKQRRAVRTASALQARKPIYRGSSQDWRRYETFLHTSAADAR